MQRPPRAARLWLWIELTLLYVLVPPIIAGLIQPELGDDVLRKIGIAWVSFQTGLPSGLFVFPLLLLTFVSMIIFLRLDPTFDNKQLWNAAGFKRDLRRIIKVFLPSAVIIFGVTWLLAYK
ncbi:MAG: hypothetical protein AAGA55_10870, partial [Planctomycetota bacterium]